MRFPPKLTTATILLVAAALMTTRPATGQDATPAPPATTLRTMDTTRAALEKWVETARIIEQERRDWALGKQILSDRIALIRSQIQDLRQKITDAEATIKVTDAMKADLIAESEQLKEASVSLETIVGPLEQRTLELLERVPVPIREQVKPLSQLISRVAPEDRSTKEKDGAPKDGAPKDGAPKDGAPKDGAPKDGAPKDGAPKDRAPKDRAPVDRVTKAELPLGDRFRNVVGILNEVNKFNRAIKVTPEVRTLADGSTAEVATLYIGIGQAYYVTAKGDAAGIGTATADGWVWKPRNEAAAAIGRAIAIFKNEQVATFVSLPMHLDR